MKMLTVQEVKALVIEMEAEEKKTKYVPHYYKRNGKILERSYPDRIQTARYEELFYDRENKLLRGEAGKIFKCCDCGKMWDTLIQNVGRWMNWTEKSFFVQSAMKLTWERIYKILSFLLTQAAA